MPKPDTLTQDIGVLKRREVEARILAPVVEAMAEAFGREEVMAVLSKTIIEIARKQGAEMSEAMGGQDAATFVQSLEAWTRGGALELETLSETTPKPWISTCGVAGTPRCIGTLASQNSEPCCLVTAILR